MVADRNKIRRNRTRERIGPVWNNVYQAVLARPAVCSNNLRIAETTRRIWIDRVLTIRCIIAAGSHGSTRGKTAATDPIAEVSAAY